VQVRTKAIEIKLHKPFGAHRHRTDRGASGLGPTISLSIENQTVGVKRAMPLGERALV